MINFPIILFSLTKSYINKNVAYYFFARFTTMVFDNILLSLPKVYSIVDDEDDDNDNNKSKNNIIETLKKNKPQTAHTYDNNKKITKKT